MTNGHLSSPRKLPFFVISQPGSELVWKDAGLGFNILFCISSRGLCSCSRTLADKLDCILCNVYRSTRCVLSSYNKEGHWKLVLGQCWTCNHNYVLHVEVPHTFFFIAIDQCLFYTDQSAILNLFLHIGDELYVHHMIYVTSTSSL